MPNLIGFHFVDLIYSDAEVARHMDLLRATNPAWINVLGGAQHEQALNFARLVRRDLPETKVIFRHYKDGSDDGMHTRLTADEWWQKIGSLYIGSDLTILTDNESGSADLTYYSDWHARIMELAAANDVGIAYGRFSVLNPPSHQWPQLKSMFETGKRYSHLHVFSPNVYYSADNFNGIAHIFEAFALYGNVPTVIGEFAFLRTITDAYNGYRSVGMDGGVYIRHMIVIGKPLWDAKIPACIYTIGAWPLG